MSFRILPAGLVTTVFALTSLAWMGIGVRGTDPLVHARIREPASGTEFLRAAAPPVSAPSEERATASFRPSDPSSARGVYLTPSNAGSASHRAEVFRRLKLAGGNAVVFDVKGSRVFFDMAPEDGPLSHELKLVMPLVNLAEVIEEARAQGIYTIARFVALKDQGLGSRRTDAQIRHPKTNVSVGTTWVDGSSQIVLDYNRESIKALALAGVDEINIDYIRYPTEYAQSQIGLTGEEKSARIEQFLRMARETIDAYRPETKLGISTYAILGWNFPVNFESVGQHIPRFAEIVDIVSPMAYPSTFAQGAYYNPATNPGSRAYYLVWKTLEGYKELVGEENARKIRPWIQGYYMTGKDLRDQIRAVHDAGLCGFSVWSAGNYYDALYPVLDDEDDSRPEDCEANAPDWF